jgi:hypothetical protein
MKPYAKAQTLRYTGLQDRRRKLTDGERAEILKLHVKQGYTYRGLARMFGVSRSLVRFICDPEALQRCRDRVKATWRKYREQRGKEENAKLPFQKALLDGELPYTIGGGIGQSRICMYFLRKAHVGEVQSSVWPEDIIAEAKAHGINLL